MQFLCDRSSYACGCFDAQQDVAVLCGGIFGDNTQRQADGISALCSTDGVCGKFIHNKADICERFAFPVADRISWWTWSRCGLCVREQARQGRRERSCDSVCILGIFLRYGTAVCDTAFCSDEFISDAYAAFDGIFGSRRSVLDNGGIHSRSCEGGFGLRLHADTFLDAVGIFPFRASSRQVELCRIRHNHSGGGIDVLIQQQKSCKMKLN